MRAPRWKNRKPWSHRSGADTCRKPAQPAAKQRADSIFLQGQLTSNVQHALDASTQQKTYLETLLQQYQSAQASLNGDSTGVSTQALDKELQDLRFQLQDLRTRYTDGHPDIVALKDKIAKNEVLRNRQMEAETAANQQNSKATNVIDFSAAEGVQRGAPTAVMQLQSQLKANQLEIQNEQQTRPKSLEAQTAEYQGSLEFDSANRTRARGGFSRV